MDNDSINRLVHRLLEDAAEENSQYLGMLVSAWMQRNDCDPEEVELVVDTSDPHKISLYPRLKPHDCGCDLREIPRQLEARLSAGGIDELW